MRLFTSLLAAACLWLLAATSAFAAAPNALSYQGRLLDSGGNPVANGSYTMVFTIWDAPVGGVSIWTSGSVSVSVADGLFSVNLGQPPMTTLPASIAADSSRWLGVAVGADPEITPRTKLVSSMFALGGGGGALDDLYVNEVGDTITGFLIITDSIAVGTSSYQAPNTFRSYGRWNPFVENGFGDFRITDGTFGFSIGVATGGGGAGHVRMWPSGGSQLVTIATPLSGDQFWVDGNLNKVFTLSPFSVNTSASLAPLTVQTADNWRWDVGSGQGDFRLADGFGQGLSIGVASGGGGAGTVRFWSSGGVVQDMLFGSPSFGEIMEILGSGDINFRSPFMYWYASGIQRMAMSPATAELLMYNAAGSLRAQVAGGSGGSLAFWDDDGDLSTQLIGSNSFGGLLLMSRDDGNAGVTVRGGISGDGEGGVVQLMDGTGSLLPTIGLYGGAAGDDAVELPTDAVNSLEMLDETGIATSRLTSGFALSASSISQNILTVTVTTPAAGYIVVEGNAYHQISGTGAAFAWMQISETSNRSRENGHYNWTGTSNFANAGGYGYFTTQVRRVYNKPAGSYTFYLQGNLYESNTVGVTGAIFTPSWLQATFYPTSYGSVQTIVEQAGDNPEASPVTIEDPQTGATSSAVLVDLSYYQKKAREAKLLELQARNARLAAELELARAQLQANTAANSK